MITVTITEIDLPEYEECEGGICEFWYLYPSGVASIEWNVENQIALLKSDFITSGAMDWLGQSGLLPPYALAGADLSRLDLKGLCLEHADLCGANLSQSSLIGVDLDFANLYGADCRGTDFTGANFHYTNLTNIITDEFTKGLPS